MKIQRNVLLGLAGVALILSFSATPARGKGKPKPAHTQAEGYAGSDACAVCHEDLSKKFSATPHASVETNKRFGWEGNGCESCHGPGVKHGEAAEAKFILEPLKEKVAAKADASCLACHRNQATSSGRIKGSHGDAQVSCVSCHSVHYARPDRNVPSLAFREPGTGVTRMITDTLHSRSAAITEQCSSCHAGAAAQFARPHSHKLQQGAMGCTDCHNPHGSNQNAGFRTLARTSSNEPGCLKCHIDKRGPFAFEHAPVRLEGCSACHENHGSSNPRMLLRADVASRCLECHGNLPVAGVRPTLGITPPSFHDLRNPVYQNCTVCHAKIHGSHVSKALLR